MLGVDLAKGKDSSCTLYMKQDDTGKYVPLHGITSIEINADKENHDFSPTKELTFEVPIVEFTQCNVDEEAMLDKYFSTIFPKKFRLISYCKALKMMRNGKHRI